MLRLLVVLAVAGMPAALLAADPLPEGDEGIAANYPDDGGIGDDAAVIFFEDFESYSDSSEFWDRWDNFFQQDQTRVATEAGNVWAGSQAVEFTLPQQDQELSNGLVKFVDPELDVLFLRYYSKFSTPFDVVGSSHNGSWISSHYEDEDGQSTPGIPADGTNKYLVAYENWRGEASEQSPGLLNVYVYHPLQRDDYGDHFFPTGLVSPNTSLPFDFGPEFVPREDVIQDLDRWYCYELMVQANTPGENDGRIAFWIDGVLAADFLNLRLRDVDTLTIDRFGVGFHAGNNPSGEQKKWYDNIVAAGQYIGPMAGEDAGGTDSAGTDTGGSDSAGSDSNGSGATTTGDSGGGTSAGSDGASAGTADASASGTDGGSAGSADDEDRGCGCTTSSTSPPLWLLLGLVVTRRRRDE
jgi:MYXO-CTERM domain-containing protein